MVRRQVAISLFDVQCFSEQAPNPDSRVTLGEKRDTLGLPQPKLDLRLSEIDKRTISRTLQIFMQELEQNPARAGRGNFRIGPRNLLSATIRWEPRV